MGESESRPNSYKHIQYGDGKEFSFSDHIITVNYRKLFNRLFFIKMKKKFLIFNN